jgi:hypothetical protein
LPEWRRIRKRRTMMIRRMMSGRTGTLDVDGPVVSRVVLQLLAECPLRHHDVEQAADPILVLKEADVNGHIDTSIILTAPHWW